jgi:hypothetical protein
MQRQHHQVEEIGGLACPTGREEPIELAVLVVDGPRQETDPPVGLLFFLDPARHVVLDPVQSHAQAEHGRESVR